MNRHQKKRKYQIYDALTDRRSSSRYYKQTNHRQVRHEVTQLCHQALRAPQDIENTQYIPDWDSFDRVYINWGRGDRWNWKHNSKHLLQISGEELRALPQWIQHDIQKNLSKADFDNWWDENQPLMSEQRRIMYARRRKQREAAEEELQELWLAYRRSLIDHRKRGTTVLPRPPDHLSPRYWW